jgi:hypothetical protein
MSVMTIPPRWPFTVSVVTIHPQWPYTASVATIPPQWPFKVFIDDFSTVTLHSVCSDDSSTGTLHSVCSDDSSTGTFHSVRGDGSSAVTLHSVCSDAAICLHITVSNRFTPLVYLEWRNMHPRGLGRLFFHHRPGVTNTVLWRAAYTPGWRSNQLGVPYQPCTVPVYELLCNC